MRRSLLNSSAGNWRAILFLSAIPLVLACGGEEDGGDVWAPVQMAATVTGTVISLAFGAPVAGAEVSIGPATATTGSDGRFELTGLTRGPATLRCIAAGFEDFEMDVTVLSGSITQTILLTPADLTPVDPSAPLEIWAGLSARWQSVRVLRAGRDVNDAVVTVNGVAIPYCCGDLYSGELPEAVPAGSPLNLEVMAGEVTVEATGNMLEAPVITAPATGSVFALTDSITVTWTSATNPDRFEVCLNCWNSLYGAIYPTPGTARELKIAASGLVDFGDGAIVAVFAFDDDGLSFTGPVDPDSHGGIVSRSADAVITIREPVAVGSDVLRVYDLTALIESFDPNVGIGVGDIEGGFYTAVVTLSQDSPDAPEFRGTFADWHFNLRGEKSLLWPDGTGLVSGFFDRDREIIFTVNDSWLMRGIVLDSGDIEGTWSHDHFSGTFTAIRRQTE